MSGVYAFTVYAVTTKQSNGPLYIKNGGTILCEAFVTQNGQHETATCSAIVELTTDDLIRVTGAASDHAFIEGGSSGLVGHYIGSNQ